MSYGVESSPLAIAHRGGMELGPENTLLAFGRALDLGLRYLETDVRVTSDGGLYCFHDETLDRVTAASGPFAARSSGYVRRLRVGGEPVPTLAEALEAYPEARFTVDLKEAAAIEPLVTTLRRSHAAARVCVAGSVGRLDPGGPGAGARGVDRARLAKPHGPDRGRPGRPAATPGRRDRTLCACRDPARTHAGFAERVVAMAHELGIRVVVWTVNDTTAMRRLLDVGVDGVNTDRPAALRDVMIARGWAPMAGNPAA